MKINFEPGEFHKFKLNQLFWYRIKELKHHRSLCCYIGYRKSLIIWRFSLLRTDNILRFISLECAGKLGVYRKFVFCSFTFVFIILGKSGNKG